MKICTISYHCCPYSLMGKNGVGGMNVYLRELSSILATYPGNEIDIFTRKQKSDIPEIKEILPGLRVIHLTAGPERSMERPDLYDLIPEFSRNLSDFIRKERISFDLIFSHYWLSGLIGEKIKKELDLPLIHMYHTLAFLKKRAFSKNGEHECRMEGEKHLSRTSDRIFTSSDYEKQDLMQEFKIYPHKVKVIYPGINSMRFFPINGKEKILPIGCQPDDLIFLYVGRIEPIKGFMTLVEALKVMKSRKDPRFSQIKLLVIGGGEKSELSQHRELNVIRNKIKEFEIEDHILFLGSQKQEILNKYYSAAHALIVPSLYESFGLVVLESLACGTPVLLSRVGQMKSIITEGKNGFSFTPGDANSISRTIDHFLSHKQELWSESRIRDEVVNKFSWNQTASAVDASFRNLIRAKLKPTTISQHGDSPQPV